MIEIWNDMKHLINIQLHCAVLSYVKIENTKRLMNMFIMYVYIDHDSYNQSLSIYWYVQTYNKKDFQYGIPLGLCIVSYIF